MRIKLISSCKARVQSPTGIFVLHANLRLNEQFLCKWLHISFTGFLRKTSAKKDATDIYENFISSMTKYTLTTFNCVPDFLVSNTHSPLKACRINFFSCTDDQMVPDGFYRLRIS